METSAHLLECHLQWEPVSRESDGLFHSPEAPCRRHAINLQPSRCNCLSLTQFVFIYHWKSIIQSPTLFSNIKLFSATSTSDECLMALCRRKLWKYGAAFPRQWYRTVCRQEKKSLLCAGSKTAFVLSLFQEQVTIWTRVLGGATWVRLTQRTGHWEWFNVICLKPHLTAPCYLHHPPFPPSLLSLFTLLTTLSLSAPLGCCLGSSLPMQLCHSHSGVSALDFSLCTLFFLL